MTPIRLEWQRPVGLELVDRAGLHRLVQGEADGRTKRGRLIRMKSDLFIVTTTDQTESVTYELTNLENPIVLHFINSWTDKDRLAFLSRFGFLERSSDILSNVEAEQERLGAGLLFTKTWGSLHHNPIWHANNILTGDKPRRHVSLRPSLEEVNDSIQLVMRPDSLLSYLAMEVALAFDARAVLTNCEHCGKFFLTGPLTGRRSHAKYCSDRCRVAAMRKRNAAAMES